MTDQPDCAIPHPRYGESACTQPPGHDGCHAAPLIIDGRECGAAAWGPDYLKDTAPADLRQQYTDAIRQWWDTDDGGAEEIADAVMAVRDAELEQARLAREDFRRAAEAGQQGRTTEVRLLQAELDQAREVAAEAYAIRNAEWAKAVTRAERAEAAIDRVRALHQPAGDPRDYDYGKAPCVGCEDDHPCDTIRALDSTGQLAPGSEQDTPVDWEAVVRRRERELKTVGEARHQAETRIKRALHVIHEWQRDGESNDYLTRVHRELNPPVSGVSRGPSPAPVLDADQLADGHLDDDEPEADRA